MPQCNLDHSSDIFGTPGKLLISSALVTKCVRRKVLAWFLTAVPITLTIIQLYPQGQRPLLSAFSDMKTTTWQTVLFGPYTLDVRCGELRKFGTKVKMGEQTFQILRLLLEAQGELVTREELRAKLWAGDTFVDFDHGLNSAVQRLRDCLSDSAEKPRWVETVPRRGYRFVGQVEWSEKTIVNGGTRETPADEPTASATCELAEEQKTGESTPAPTISLFRRWRTASAASLVLVGLLGLAVAMLALVGLNVRSWRDRVFIRSPKTQIQALAVLPMTNLSGDPEQEYFADGMTESLITELGKISTPRVVSRQSVMQYKASKKSLQEIARELKVDAVLEGAVERSGGRVRVTVHLSQAFPERQLWTQEYDRSIRDALSLQGEIARAITDEIQVKLTPEERTRLAASRPVNPEAQDDYLRGLYFGGNYTEVGLQTAIANFKAAIEKDPTYAPAYAELAMAYFWLGNPEQGGPSARETLPQARAAVTKALQLDPSLARAHLALGLIILTSDWNWSGAENQYRLALELNPNCGECHAVYGALLAGLGRSDEAIVQTNRAIELDPLSSENRKSLAVIAFFSRQYDLAIKQCENLNDDNSPILVGLSYAQKNMYPEAISILEKSVARSGRLPGILGLLAQVYGLAGKKHEAQKIIDELKESSRHHYVFPSVFANAYLGLGDKDQALTFLERAYEEQDPELFNLKVWPLLDPLRSEPRFQALMRRVNLAQ
jgi:TolB-like protein/DNA-binding winged helix-turn-helix (wHTH) protein/Tfp pilus assembly protein PilF